MSGVKRDFVVVLEYLDIKYPNIYLIEPVFGLTKPDLDCDWILERP